MTHVRCSCGHHWSETVIPAEGYANHGWIMRDQDREAYYGDTAKQIAEFIDAVVSGRRDEWIRQKFGAGYPTELENADIVDDIMSLGRKELFVFQCESCGRLWVQEAPFEGNYQPFKPEGDWKDILAVHKSTQPEHLEERSAEGAE